MQAEGLQVHIRTDKLEMHEFMTTLEKPLQASIFLANEGIKLLKCKPRTFLVAQSIRICGLMQRTQV